MNSARAYRRLLLTLLAGGSLALAACGASVLAEADVEAAAAEELAAATGEDAPDIDCPGDLEAEVGATMECDLTVEGDDAVFPVTVTVTSVEDGTANYSVEVGEAPDGGDTVEEDPAAEDETRPADGEGDEGPAGEELPAE